MAIPDPASGITLYIGATGARVRKGGGMKRVTQKLRGKKSVPPSARASGREKSGLTDKFPVLDTDYRPVQGANGVQDAAKRNKAEAKKDGDRPQHPIARPRRVGQLFGPRPPAVQAIFQSPAPIAHRGLLGRRVARQPRKR